MKKYFNIQTGDTLLTGRLAILLLFFWGTAIPVFSQGHGHTDSLLVGTWRGTSICQVHPSPCHDEISVCHISKGPSPDSFHIVMNKVINGKEEDMGVLNYRFDPKDNSLFGYESQFHVTIKLVVNGNKMEGVLLDRNKVVYRVIRLTKDPA